MQNLSVESLLASKGEGQTVVISGWIRTRRESRNVIFLELNDGSCMKNLQVVADKNDSSFDRAVAERLQTGASLTVTGSLISSEGKEQSVEVQASRIEIIGDSPEDYPLQKKRHSFEFLRDMAHLRPRTNTFGAVARVRNALSSAVHSFFQERGFLWIHTPLITANDAEGAGSLFQVTTLDLEKKPDYSKDFFGKKTFLTVSGQLQAEPYASAMRNVYTFGPTFRAENSNTSRHLSEFWMIEPEMAFCDIDGNRKLAEEFTKFLLKNILKQCPEDMAFFNQWIQKGTIEALENVITKPFVHLSYTEAMKELTGAKVEWEFPPSWGIDLQSEHEKYITETVVDGPVVITDYPRDIKAFYMKQNSDGKTVRAMDVLVPRLGEIIGGSQREDDGEKLRSRMKEMEMDENEYGWYIDLRRFGSVPHSGFGMGFDRVVQYVTGMQNIRDTIAFPRTPGSIAF